MGKYIYADYVTGNMWALTYEDGSVQNNELLHSTNLNITTFGTDSGNELYFGSFSDGKIYKFDGTPVTSVGSNTPNKFQLYQNYPNPFNPKTQITFELEDKNHVTLEVYDSIGRKLDKIYEGTADAGKTEVTWNSKDYPSGVYIYKLSTESKSISKKMMVMK
jgi:hypothetical protein